MDFTQHNKINSFIPNQNRVIDCRQNPQNFKSSQQYAKYQPFSACPSYQQPSMYSQQQQMPQQQFNNQNINRNPMPHHYGDGGGSDRMHSMVTKSFKPYSFNSPAMKNCTMPQKKSYYDDSMMMKSHDMEPIVSEDQIVSSIPIDLPFWAKRQENENKISGNNDDDLNIEYFQCAAPPKTASYSKRGQATKSFQQESMRKFSDTDDIRKALENHQTYFFSHSEEETNDNDKDECCGEEEEESEIINNQDSYKSRTKIIPIPNGVRIITEIVKNGDCGNEIFRNFRHLPTLNDKRLSKKSNTLDDDSGNNNDDICCNGISNKNEKDEDEVDNGHQNDIRSLVNL